MPLRALDTGAGIVLRNNDLTLCGRYGPAAG